MRFLALNPLALAVVAICSVAHAQDTPRPATTTTAPATTPQADQGKTPWRAIEQAAQQVTVSGQRSIGDGLMTVQSAPKAVSTVTRETITKAAPGANYAQMIGSIPGVVAISDDPTGLFDGNYQIRGFTNDEIGVTVNGAPVNDSGSYTVYPTEYGDTESQLTEAGARLAQALRTFWPSPRLTTRGWRRWDRAGPSSRRSPRA